MERIDIPGNVEICLNDGFCEVFDLMWNRLDSEENPIKCRTECKDWQVVTLAEIQQQYGDRLIVVYETFLDGAIYRLGNYSDGKWYKVGTLCGFA